MQVLGISSAYYPVEAYSVPVAKVPIRNRDRGRAEHIAQFAKMLIPDGGMQLNLDRVTYTTFEH